MQGAHKHGARRFRLGILRLGVSAVRDDPGYHLHLLASSSLARHSDEVLASGLASLALAQVRDAVRNQQLDRLLVVEDQVNVAYKSHDM